MIAEIFSVIILALTVSADSFAVGISYGLKQVMTPLKSVIIIIFCTGIAVLMSMGLGLGLMSFISVNLAKTFGNLLLIFIGIFTLFSLLRNKTENPSDRNSSWTLNLKKIRIVIEVIKTPSKADLDNSGNISSMEAFFLGLAVSLDAFGAGMGASLSGFGIGLTTITIGLMSGTALLIGTLLGKSLSKVKFLKHIRFLPGIILIFLGVYNML